MAVNIHVVSFEDFNGADNMLANINDWEEKGWIKVEDAVVVTRGSGKEVPSTGMVMPNTERPVVIPGPSGNADIEIKQTVKQGGKYALGGGGIGLLAGLLLGGPIGGLVVGATLGAITGALKDYGIEDSFIREVSSGLRPGTSALFLMTSAGDDEKIFEELKSHKGQLLKTTLSPEREAGLRKALDK